MFLVVGTSGEENWLLVCVLGSRQRGTLMKILPIFWCAEREHSSKAVLAELGEQAGRELSLGELSIFAPGETHCHHVHKGVHDRL